MGNVKPIQLLDNSVAQRIAAGEVIERPESIVRELLDNAIDAGAGSIEIHITDGGISEIKIIDDGSGMSREDLAICCNSHATSKISRVEDLYALETLGFRGEALYSISACTRLTICSRQGDSVPYTITINDGLQTGPEPGGNSPGTTITARDLFFSIPGRRKFLKRPQAEATACKKTFTDKALPFPAIQFKFFINNSLRLLLPPSTLLQRILNAYPTFLKKEFMRETSVSSGNFSITAVCSTPEIYRSDKTGIQVFVNKRRIQEYSLIQAVMYGYTDYLPGGSFPYCYLFIEIDPELVDFNIHPAKREAKIRNIAQVHHETVQMLKSWLFGLRSQAAAKENRPGASGAFNKTETPSPYLTFSNTRNTPGPVKVNHTAYAEAFDAVLQENPKRKRLPGDVYEPSFQYPGSTETADISSNSNPALSRNKIEFIYHGQIFNLFLLAELSETFLLIDQHAAHERIIYEELIAKPASQPLLIPYVFEPDPLIEDFLVENAEIYRRIGIEIERKELGIWELKSLPSACRTIQQQVLDFILQSAGNASEIEKKLYSMIACKAAIKDGDIIDSVTARNLIAKALELPVPRCPHGRPIWKEISRDQLFRDVERIL
jgi:DNA mismatch repair protein MutL